MGTAARHGVTERASFADDSSGPILIFAAGSHGDVAPIGAIGGPFTGLSFYGSGGIAIGPAVRSAQSGPDRACFD